MITLPKIFAPGAPEPTEARKFIANYPKAAYHGDKEALNQGAMLCLADETPAHFLHEWAKPYVDEGGSDVMRLGTMTHEALFEPDVYARYMVQPNFGDGRYKAAQDAKAEWLQGVPAEWVDVETNDKGKEKRTLNGKAKIITAREKAAVEGMALGLVSHPTLRSLGVFDKPMLAEQTVYWVDEETRILQRARLDLVSVKNRLVLDLKSTEKAHAYDFSRHIGNMRYDFQGAHYMAAGQAVDPSWVNNSDYVFMVAEREPPYVVAVYLLDEGDLARATAERRGALKLLRECIETNKWPGYSDRIEPIKVPPFARRAQPGVVF